MKKEAAPVVKGNVSIPQSAIQIDKLDQYNPVRLEFTVTRTEVTSDGGKPVSFEEFSRKNPSNLTLFWVVYQALGRTDASGEKIQYVYNPNYVAGSSPPEERYIGMIVRGVKTNTGETGDFAVKISWTKASPSSKPQWEPVMLSPDTVDMSQVLFRVKPGTVGEPQKDDLSAQGYRMPRAAREPSSSSSGTTRIRERFRWINTRIRLRTWSERSLRKRSDFFIFKN